MDSRRLFLIIIVCIMTLSIYGCSSKADITDTAKSRSETGNVNNSTSAEINAEGDNAEAFTTKGLRYVLVVKNLANPYWVSLADGMKAYCEENDITLEIKATAEDASDEEQLTICRTLLGKNYDAIFVTPLGNISICSFIKECNVVDQPIFILDSAADNNTLASLGARPTATFEADHYTAGCVATEYLVEALGGKGKIVILTGNMNSEAAIQINYGIQDTLEEFTNIKVIDMKSAYWTRSMSYKNTEELLSAHPDIDGILAANDEMGLGALDAVMKAGLLGKISIVSINFMKNVQDAIKQGRIYASVDKSPYKQGTTSAEVATEFLSGEPIQDYYQIPVVGYTSEDF
jgi:ribose transport system substrate-binding protein